MVPALGFACRRQSSPPTGSARATLAADSGLLRDPPAILPWLLLSPHQGFRLSVSSSISLDAQAHGDERAIPTRVKLCITLCITLGNYFPENDPSGSLAEQAQHRTPLVSGLEGEGEHLQVLAMCI